MADGAQSIPAGPLAFPASEAEAAPVAKPLKKSPGPGESERKKAFKCIGLALLLLVGSVFGVDTDLQALSTVVCVIATVLALMGFFNGVLSLYLGTVGSQPLGSADALLSVIAVLGGAVLSLYGVVITVFSTFGFRRGRQLRSFGKVLLPTVEEGAGWTTQEISAAVDPSVASALAAQWRDNGRTEHASVGAFARLTLDLMALGAPPDLIAAANRDALDEIRHTELCFSLARALDGKEESPGAFPEAQRARTLPSNRTFALAQLAVDSLVDGALHEGLSARLIARLAKRCEVKAITKILLELAADEGRHAAHGWDVVEWCLATGGAPVASALTGALKGLPKAMQSPLPEGAAQGGWERYGVHGHALEAEEFARARADLSRRVTALVGQQAAAA